MAVITKISIHIHIHSAESTDTGTTYDMLENYAYSAGKKHSAQAHKATRGKDSSSCCHRPTVAALFPSTFPKSVLVEAVGTGDRTKPARICILHCAPLPVLCTEENNL